MVQQSSDSETKQSAAPSPGGNKGKRRRTWMSTHGRDLRFLAIFGLLMGVYYWATTTSAVEDDFFPWYLNATTQVSGKSLHAMGYDDMVIEGKRLVGPKRTVEVARGCDAVAPTALFVSAVLASPVALGSRLIAVVGGVLILMIINVVRIVTLYLTAVHWPKGFDIMHLDVWQFAFIVLAGLMWALWASTMTQRQAKKRHASA